MKVNSLTLLLLIFILVGCSQSELSEDDSVSVVVAEEIKSAKSRSPREVSAEYLRLCEAGDIEAVRQLITPEALARVDAVDAGDPCADLPPNFATATFVDDDILNQNATTIYAVDWDSNFARIGDQMTLELRLANRSDGWQLTALKTEVVRATPDATRIPVTLLPVVPLVSPDPNVPTEEPSLPILPPTRSP